MLVLASLIDTLTLPPNAVRPQFLTNLGSSIYYFSFVTKTEQTRFQAVLNLRYPIVTVVTTTDSSVLREHNLLPAFAIRNNSEEGAHMTPEMAFESLLVSGDPALACTMASVLDSFSIEVEHSRSAVRACELIAGRKYELVIIDWDGDDSYRFLHAIWNLPKRRTPTIVALSASHPHIAGAHFTIRKPVEIGVTTQSLKAVYSHMALDYRVSARFALMANVVAKDKSGRRIPVTVTDIGEGGIGFASKETLIQGDELSLILPLPQAPVPLHIQTRILWTRDYGTAGGYFLSMPPFDRHLLSSWFRAKTQVKKPRISVEE